MARSTLAIYKIICHQLLPKIITNIRIVNNGNDKEEKHHANPHQNKKKERKKTKMAGDNNDEGVSNDLMGHVVSDYFS